MGPELKQTQRLQLELKLTLQMQQTLKLLQVNRQELIQIIRQEVEQNPVLSIEDVPEYISAQQVEEYPREDSEGGENSLYSNLEGDFQTPPYDYTEKKYDESDDIEDERRYQEYIFSRTEGQSLVGESEGIQEDRNIRLSTHILGKSLTDHLLEQLRLTDLNEKDKEIGYHIIMNLNDDGYLKGDSEEQDLIGLIAIQAKALEEDVLRVLKIIQEFDPPGIAARNYKECLIIQARHCKNSDLIIKVIENHMQDLERKRYPVIAKALNISEEAVREIEKIISGFNPKPGAAFNTPEPEYITPDVEIYKSNGEFKVRLLKDNIPRVYINRDYLGLMKRRGRDPNSKFIRNNYKLAKIFLNALNDREKRIRQVAEIILERQREFFEKGEGHLKPLLEKEIAAQIGVGISTVSRIFNSKYILTPFGIYPMKYFIRQPFGNVENETISNDVVKNLVKKMIDEEDPKYPLKDDEIVRRLSRQNINISRRTVAKYREAMGIPPYNIRKRTKQDLSKA